jgi:hypothetical protein
LAEEDVLQRVERRVAVWLLSGRAAVRRSAIGRRSRLLVSKLLRRAVSTLFQTKCQKSLQLYMHVYVYYTCLLTSINLQYLLLTTSYV